MVETQPTVTTRSCDRCGKKIVVERRMVLTLSDTWHREGRWISIDGQHQGRTYDLCQHCSERFDEFMGHPTETKDDKVFADKEEAQAAFSRSMNGYDTDRPIGNTG